MNGICVDCCRWFYVYYSQYLQQVVLEYIVYCVRIIVIIVVFFYIQEFCVCDFYVINKVMVLQWFKYVVGKVEYQQVLYGFFIKVVVDMVDLMFFEVVVDFYIQILCRLQIVIKRFFDDQMFLVLVFIVEVMCCKVSWDYVI